MAEIESIENELSFHPVASLFPMLEGAEFDALAQDIAEHGLLEPIWVFKSRIIDGRSRYRACRRVGIIPQFRQWDGVGSLVEFIVSLNLHRRHLTVSQRACVAVDLLPLLEEEARKRQQESRAKPGEKIGNVGPISASPLIGRSREKAARSVQVGKTAVSDAKKLKAEMPKLFEKVRAGTLTLQQAKQEIKMEKKLAVVVRIKQEPRPTPKGPFRVIVIDPPWKYNSRADDGTHRARNPFPDMAIEEITALRVPELAHQDCVLWLWTTNAFLEEAYGCVRAWGFEPKTLLTWVKDRMGLGDWLRGRSEHCIMAVRGRPGVTLTSCR